MATGVFAFNQATSTSAEGSLSDVMTALQGSLTSLGAFVAAVKGKWDGAEMELYDQIQQRWDDSAEQVQEILEGVREALQSVNSAFGDLRQGVRDSLKEA